MNKTNISSPAHGIVKAICRAGKSAHTCKNMRRSSAITFLLAILTTGLSCTSIAQPVKESYVETQLVAENRTETVIETVPVTKIVTGEEPIQPYIMWSNPGLTFSGYDYVWYYGYNLAGLPHHDKWQLIINIYEQKYFENTVLRVFDMSPRGQILAPPSIASSDTIPSTQVQQTWLSPKIGTGIPLNWLSLANVKLNYARFLGGRSNLWSDAESSHALELDPKSSSEIAVVISGPTFPQNARFSTSLAWSDNVTLLTTVQYNRQVPYEIENKLEKQRTVIKTVQVPFWELLLPK